MRAILDPDEAMTMLDTSSRSGRLITRRQWVVGSFLGGIGLAARGAEPEKAAAEGAVDLSDVFDHARKVKLAGFRSSRTPHYVGVGNARDAFRGDALRICELLAKEFHRVFRDPKFAVYVPTKPLTVITMKDRRSYEIYLGESSGADVGGHYDLANNRLMIFDFAADAEDRAVAASRLNLFSLVHEGLHQLCFNTGLLDRNADNPVAISEGLAMYGEIWRPKSSNSFGAVNSSRLAVLVDQDPDNAEWYPVSRLLTRDDLFEGENTRQLAYAEAWALVHYLMSVPRRAKFQAYLEQLRGARASSERLKLAAKCLGDLARLDRDVKHHAYRQRRAG